MNPRPSTGPSLGAAPALFALALFGAIAAFMLFRSTASLKVGLDERLIACEWKISGSVGNRTDDPIVLNGAVLTYLDEPSGDWVTVDLLASPVELPPNFSSTDDMAPIRSIVTLNEPCPLQSTKILHEKVDFSWTPASGGRARTQSEAF